MASTENTEIKTIRLFFRFFRFLVFAASSIDVPNYKPFVNKGELVMVS